MRINPWSRFSAYGIRNERIEVFANVRCVRAALGRKQTASMRSALTEMRRLLRRVTPG